MSISDPFEESGYGNAGIIYGIVNATRGQHAEIAAGHNFLMQAELRFGENSKRSRDATSQPRT